MCHCKDINPYGEACFKLIEQIQDSQRYDKEKEKNFTKKKRKMKGTRHKNNMMMLLFTCVTAGILAGCGFHNISSPGFFKLQTGKFQLKKAKIHAQIVKLYRTDVKIYACGKVPMEKWEEYKDVLQAMELEPDRKKKALILKKANKENR